MPMLERSNPLPLYYQLKEVLKQQIRAGHLAPHTAIPSEPELVARYRVSRATVRQALTELVHEGLLYRQHGKGTFVCEPRVQQTLSELTSLSEDIRRRGKRPGGLLLVSELVRGSETVRERLRLLDEEQAIRLVRVRTADEVPIAYEVDYLPYPRATGIYQRAKELGEGSLYSMMASEGLTPYIAEQNVKAALPSAREAELLRIPPDEPGLRVTCTTFDQTGSPIAYSEVFYPGSRYEYMVTLRVAKS
ncbi:MAG: GntR family transcriptional regulator [Thermogemmatispora sp.]|jgi:GntR family transcriptional regulator|uniref:HTH-type transcriptional repressor YvoA n=1 Tax=Thermogemmatispora aurantia TaxID=2045279 RepID=A0A5J4K4P2_9CHLR|nr:MULTISPECIES: GntR family transcriptional regulator [Thermogemmatispora]MBE3565548.1 GntR family transcriptional regulator [Thermogemmatispora sp.]GER81687.1 HTH-type transcriptional repressor YvoA [Thermogemmatispora aurantia]